MSIVKRFPIHVNGISFDVPYIRENNYTSCVIYDDNKLLVMGKIFPEFTNASFTTNGKNYKQLPFDLVSELSSVALAMVLLAFSLKNT